MGAIAKELEMYSSRGPGMQDPAEDIVDVDISADDHTFTVIPKYTWVGGNGDLKIITLRGTTIVIPNVIGGSLLPIRPQKIIKVGTTCTDIQGWY